MSGYADDLEAEGEFEFDIPYDIKYDADGASGRSAEPFFILSSNDASGASASDSYDNNTPLSTPPSATHDTSRAEFHVKDLETFAKDLQYAADRAFPNSSLSKPRYGDVSVLLLRWEDDEMNVKWELDDLEKIFREYGYGTERWLIPRKNAHLKLMSKAVEIVEEHDGKDDLVIVYYAGHAFINNARQATWSCKANPSYASLEWSAIQTLFEKAHFDVLLLLDCCAAASAAPRVGSAVTETIAACGFESIAPQPGRFSFTNSLIGVLEDWIDSPPFSAAMLHNRVLSVLKHERPERAKSGKRRKFECRTTPIHIVATADPTLPSIELGGIIRPRSQSPTASNAKEVPAATEETGQTVTTNADFAKLGESPVQTSSLKRKAYQPDSINEITGDDYEVPRVIISLALEKHQTLNSESCQKWLTCCPTLVNSCVVVNSGFTMEPIAREPSMFICWICNFPKPANVESQRTFHDPISPIVDQQHKLPQSTDALSDRPRLGKDEVTVLEGVFQKLPKPSNAIKRKIAQGFGVDLCKINNWFQNRRAKQKHLAFEASLRGSSSGGSLDTATIPPGNRTIIQTDLRQSLSREVHAFHANKEQTSRVGEDDGYWSAGVLMAMRLDEMPYEESEDSDAPIDVLFKSITRNNAITPLLSLPTPDNNTPENSPPKQLSPMVSKYAWPSYGAYSAKLYGEISSRECTIIATGLSNDITADQLAHCIESQFGTVPFFRLCSKNGLKLLIVICERQAEIDNLLHALNTKHVYGATFAMVPRKYSPARIRNRAFEVTNMETNASPESAPYIEATAAEGPPQTFQEYLENRLPGILTTNVSETDDEGDEGKNSVAPRHGSSQKAGAGGEQGLENEAIVSRGQAIANTARGLDARGRKKRKDYPSPCGTLLEMKRRHPSVFDEPPGL